MNQTVTKRLTFVVAPDVEVAIASAKKEIFYDKTRSDMIRELIRIGLEVACRNNTAKSQ